MPHFGTVLGTGLVLLLCGCTAAGGLPSGNAELDGAWGGLHAGLTLTAEGGTTSYDCAHGTLGAPVRPDREGRFEVAGLHVREHGGPVRMGEVPDSEPARYLGRVTGDQMVLRVVVGSDTLGPFTLKRGAAPQLFRCL
jgi:hypothetical protein